MKPTADRGRKPGNGAKRRAIAPVASALVAAALLAAPTAAQAIGLQNLSSQPVDTQAGANADYNIHIQFTNPGDDVKDVTIGLPPGQVGDPTATPLCTVAQLNADTCPATSDVGNASSVVDVIGLGLGLTVPGDLYNLVAQPGEPARFGVVLRPPLGLPKVILQSAVQLRPDFGLNTLITDIPNTAGGLPINILSMDVQLAGLANGQPFSRNPTSCSLATTNFSATSYTGATSTTPATGQASYTPTGCANLPFSPTFTAKVGAPGLTAKGSKPPATTVIDQDDGEAGLRRASVQLPGEIGGEFAQLAPSELCQLPEFEAGSCPLNSLVGTAVATSPLLTQPLTGPVNLVNAGLLAQVGVALRGQLSLNLRGDLDFTNTTTFDGLPDIPIAHFELRFSGGPDGLLFAGRNLCLPPAPIFHTSFEAHSGASLVGDIPATVEGCGPIRKPDASVRLANAGSENPSLRLKVQAGSSPVDRVKLKLPKGLDFEKGGKVSAKAEGKRLPKGVVDLKGRKLNAKLHESVDSLVVRVGGGALDSAGGISGRLKFPLKIVDEDDTLTRLAARTRARR
jgi:hypothetical protein